MFTSEQYECLRALNGACLTDGIVAVSSKHDPADLSDGNKFSDDPSGVLKMLYKAFQLDGYDADTACCKYYTIDDDTSELLLPGEVACGAFIIALYDKKLR